MTVKVVLCILLFFSDALPAALAVYTGKLEKTDRQLVEHFIKKSALYGKYGRVSRLREILLELKTAEKILNRRSRPLMKRLARAYLNAAQGFLFYFNYSKRMKAEFLVHAELCLKSAHSLDRSNFGRAVPFHAGFKAAEGGGAVCPERSCRVGQDTQAARYNAGRHRGSCFERENDSLSATAEGP